MMDSVQEQTLNLATWISCTESEGPGKRFALWVQGCAIRCPGCCNPEMFGFVPKHLKPVSEVLSMILEAQREYEIQGITCLGGEPFAQALALAELTRQTQEHGLSVMLFSGYTLEKIQAENEPGYRDLLANIDLFVDGPYQAELRTNERRWIGSTNQRVHYFTERYREDGAYWKQPNAVEITFDGKELQISGFPLWQKQMEEWKRVLALREKDSAKKRKAEPPKK